ncbi:helix-turn-helix transcriptional regulator [Saccharothrix sp.]|uniref:helix-turn-helix transcriptional regulator n=1 Tax=Saccharothrix sp. TaxID=1873460 RepID=UPI002810D350|nr:helix-turn-helix transcriptional regulator [Saccharothrix sp.]
MTTQRASSPLWVYIEDELRKRGLTTGDFVRGIGVNRSALTGWRDGKSMTIDTARSIAALFDVPILDVLVGTGVITQQEARRRPAVQPDPTEMSDEELFRELAERLRYRLWLSSFVSTPLPSKGLDDDATGRPDVESNLCPSGIGGSPRPPRTLGDGASDADGGRGAVVDWWERREYEDMVGKFRRVVGSLPYWTVDEHDGEPVLVDVEGDEVLLRLNSQWNPNLVAFFAVFDRYRLLELVALLEVVPEGRAQRAAGDLLRALTKDLPEARPPGVVGEPAGK